MGSSKTIGTAEQAAAVDDVMADMDTDMVEKVHDENKPMDVEAPVESDAAVLGSIKERLGDLLHNLKDLEKLKENVLEKRTEEGRERDAPFPEEPIAEDAPFPEEPIAEDAPFQGEPIAEDVPVPKEPIAEDAPVP